MFPGQQECFPTLGTSALFLVRLSPTLLLPNSMNLALSLALCRPQVSSLANQTNNTTCQGCRDDILRGSGAWILAGDCLGSNPSSVTTNECSDLSLPSSPHH